MPRVQKPNVSAESCVKLSEYVYCLKKRNRPRLHYTICESKCRYNKSCVAFKSFKETRPDLYPPPTKTRKTKPRKKAVRKRGRPKKKK